MEMLALIWSFEILGTIIVDTFYNELRFHLVIGKELGYFNAFAYSQKFSLS